MSHGTATMYSKHYQQGEKPCAACKEAYSEYAKRRYKARMTGDATVTRQMKARIFDILDADGGWLTSLGIVAEVESRFGDTTPKTVSGLLRSLVDDGRVECRNEPQRGDEDSTEWRVTR